MRLRSRPLLFARVFADAVTTRPLLNALLEQRRAGESTAVPVVALTPEPPASASVCSSVCSVSKAA